MKINSKMSHHDILVPLTVLDLLTFHKSELDVGQLHKPIKIAHLDVNGELFDFNRLICGDESNLYQKYLEQLLDEESSANQSLLFLHTITLLVTRYHEAADASSNPDGNGGNPVKMICPGGECQDNERQFIGSKLTADFVLDRMKDIFEIDTSDLEGRDLGVVLKKYIDLLETVPCNPAETREMYYFIKRKLKPAMNKIRGGTALSGAGLTKEFWGVRAGAGDIFLCNEIGKDIKPNGDPKVLIAFIKENFCRVSGVSGHPVNGQHRLAFLRYLSRGISPYDVVENLTVDRSTAEMSKRVFRENPLKEMKNSVSLHLPGYNEVIDDDLITRYKNLSLKLGEQSRLAQDHGILTVVKGIVHDWKTGVVFFRPALDKLLEAFGDEGGDQNTEDVVMEAVRSVSGLFDKSKFPENGKGETFHQFFNRKLQSLKDQGQPLMGKDLNKYYLTGWYVEYWHEYGINIIRDTLITQGFDTRDTMGRNLGLYSPKRKDIFQDVNKFRERLDRFCRKKEKNDELCELSELYMFAHAEHHMAAHRFTRMLLRKNEKNLTELKNCGDLHSTDYEVVQLLLLGLYDEKSLSTVYLFSQNVGPENDQNGAKGGAEADRRLISCTILMISKIVWAFNKTIGFLRKSPQDDPVLAINKYMVAVKALEDLVTIVKSIGNDPKLKPNSFVQKFQSLMRHCDHEFMEMHIQLPEEHVKKLIEKNSNNLNEDDSNNLDEDALMSRLDKSSLSAKIMEDWKGEWDPMSLLSILFSLYIETYWECLFWMKNDGKKVPSTFAKNAYAQFQKCQSPCQFDDAKRVGMLLQPSAFISSAMAAGNEEDSDSDSDNDNGSHIPKDLDDDGSLTPNALFRGRQINPFSLDNVFKDCVSAYLDERLRCIRPNKLGDFYHIEPNDESSDNLKRRFVENAHNFQVMLCEHYGKSSSKRMKSMNESFLPSDLSEKDKERREDAIMIFNRAIDSYQNMWKNPDFPNETPLVAKLEGSDFIEDMAEVAGDDEEFENVDMVDEKLMKTDPDET